MADLQLFRLPFPMAVLGKLIEPFKRMLVPLTADSYRRYAMRATGLSDFGDDPSFDDRYATACRLLNGQNLNVFGRGVLREMMRWHLVNRLTTVDLMKRQPAVFDTPIERPIFIVGLFRTGSTFLFNTLAADPHLRAGYSWEHMYPVGRRRDPLGDIRWRKRRSLIPVYGDRLVAPDRNDVHPVTMDAIEEDFFHLGTDMAMLEPVITVGGWAYGEAMLEWDLESAYRWHKRQLQALTLQDTGRGSGKQWLMKCPWHLWNLDALMKVYPDARIIHIHRDITKTLGSECSLSARLYCRMHKDADPHKVGEFWQRYSRVGLERGQRVKDNLPESQVYDVHLSDIKADPAGQLKALYDHFGLPWSADVSARLVEASQVRHGLAGHQYQLEDYGLNAAEVRAHFSEYEARFGRP